MTLKDLRLHEEGRGTLKDTFEFSFVMKKKLLLFFGLDEMGVRFIREIIPFLRKKSFRVKNTIYSSKTFYTRTHTQFLKTLIFLFKKEVKRKFYRNLVTAGNLRAAFSL